LGGRAEVGDGEAGDLVSQAIQVRNLREGEQTVLPPTLLNTGLPYLVPEWVWVVEPASPLGPFAPPAPFAIVVCSFCHGLLVLWRILAVSPLPSGIPLNWFKEALLQVFAEARLRGCVGFLTLLADNRPAEAQMARIIARMAKGKILPFQGSMGVGPLAEVKEEGPR
jgi:hypothetical protein